MYEKIRSKKGFISDMDGVLYHGNNLLPGVVDFVNWLQENEKEFIFLTNSSERTPQELSRKLGRMGLMFRRSIFTQARSQRRNFFPHKIPVVQHMLSVKRGLQTRCMTVELI